MDEKSLRILGYNKILDMLRSHAAGDMTRAVIDGLRPYTDEITIREKLDETDAAAGLMKEEGNPPLGNIHDISFIGLTRKGGSLTAGELLKVAYNIEVSSAMKSYLTGSGFDEQAYALEEHRRLVSEIRRCIITEDEIADNASPALRDIRREMVNKQAAVKNRLESIISSERNANALRDAIVTIRDGRYVIPVKQEYRRAFPGLIHDESASGATLFIEPQAVVDLNNSLKELEAEEQREIGRILKALSEMVSEDYHKLINDMNILVELDFIFAKAKLSLSYDGAGPVIGRDGMLQLKTARHPLIDPEKVVPIDVALGGRDKALVITGPNTGGKTVTLKTCGLLAAMAQSGLHIPADSTSRIPVYLDIFADIGDEQSIEQNLSTFSSHMRNIVGIIQRAGSRALVLLDELGAGTDPAEGAALAIAIIEELMARGSYIMATTHYTELKKYAVSRDGVENASMEFDIDTLSPTYRLRTGMPGRSNAFEISYKLGLENGIVDRAKELMETGDIEFEDVLSAIEADRKKAEEEKRAAMGLVIAAKKQKEDLERREERLKEQRERILDKARDEARSIVREANETVRAVQREITRNPDAAAFSEGRKRLRDVEKKNRVNTVKVNDAPVEADRLTSGEQVRIVTLDKIGTVSELPDAKGNCYVQCGSMRIRVNVKDLAYTEQNKKPVKHEPHSGAVYGGGRDIGITKSVIGENLDDAVFIVNKYLDDASLSGLKEVTIIHGRGEGILRKGIRDMLKKHKLVRGFRPGAYNEGGDGVTVVTLR